MLEFLKNLDRRYIFILIAFSVVIPLMVPLGLPLTPGAEATSMYKLIDGLKEGSKLVISFDYDPASKAELHPMAEAILHHAFRKKLKIFAISLYPAGPSMARNAFEKQSKGTGAIYGKDYINLGFYYGPNTGFNQVAVFSENIKNAFPVDERKVSVNDYEIMDGFNSLKDANALISISAGDPGVPAYVSVANAIHKIKVGAGVTAVSAPKFFSYMDSGQIFGLLGGLKGAAEYEVLEGIKGKGLSGMDAQSMAHLVIILLIILSNIIYIIEKKD
ncbi:MAG: hypothetical protein COB02_06460 [Candidatus Cloacimonadota bacterium]|nr:MAG: hypothetical protein COB02_06460 [Candidatus Cloacimonadota bacterium]